MASLAPLTVANLAIMGTSALTGAVTASAGVNVPGSKTLNFGSDQTKGTNAGNIGYQIATAGALDIYGAGTTAGSRAVKLWDNISTGIATVSRLYVGGGLGAGVTLSMPALTASTGGGYTVSASSTYTSNPYATFPAWKAFDSSSATYWLSADQQYQNGFDYFGSVTTGSTKGEYLQVQTPSQCQLQSYSLFGSSSHNLASFSIMGSSDGTTYTTIDTRSGQDCTVQRDYTAPAQTSFYTYFRLIITRDTTNDASQYTMVSNFAPVFVGPTYPVDIGSAMRVTGSLTANGGAVVTGGLTVDGKAVTGGTGTRVPWTTLYTSGNGSNIAQYSVDASGIVRLRGSFVTVSGSSTAFTLPVGARPPQPVYFLVADSIPNFRNLYMTAAGAVNTHGNAGYVAYIDGVSYDSSAT